MSVTPSMNDPAEGSDELRQYRERWRLIPDGEPFRTHSSWLQPVLHQGEPAMLKVPFEEEERWGGGLMVWWGGEGTARVLAHDENALLLERATGNRRLEEMARNGQDEEATQILCAAAARLHAPRYRALPPMIPLTRWFAALEPGAARHGGILIQAAATARELLSTPQDLVPLHGDLHHGNVLDGGPRGWLVIDPKRLYGERGFEYANLFRNPDLATSIAPGRLARHATLVATEAGLDRTRLLKWVLALCGLSAAWILGDGEEPREDLAVAHLVVTELANP